MVLHRQTISDCGLSTPPLAEQIAIFSIQLKVTYNFGYNMKYLVTSALPYANAELHLGHVLEIVQTDAWVRHKTART